MNGVQGLGIPAFGQGPRPAGGGGGGTGIRKQRSQRFTVPYNPAGGGHARSQSGSTGSTPSPALPPPPVPPLPYLAPPPPVQAQSLTPYTIAPGPGLGPVDVASGLDFLASPTGMSPYPGPAFTSAQPTPSTSNHNGIGGSVTMTNGGGASPQDMIATGAGSDEIIETAIVIKSIPFACPKEHLLAVMASLSLPAPFAFNYHFAPEDPTSFRGLAFANYRHPSEAAMVRAAMDGLEIMGRKLRAEFKKQLRPGEKEMIERTKAIKRMRSAQMLAATGSGSGERGGGSGGSQGWQRREATAPGGYSNSLPDGFSRHGNATSFGGQQHDYAHVPPVPPIPPSFNQQQQQQQFGFGPPPLAANFSYAPPVSRSPHAATEPVNGAANFQQPPMMDPSSSSSSDVVNGHHQHHRPRQETDSSGDATGPEGGNGSSSVVSVSDVGTSVSQRAARVSAGEEEEEEEGTEGSEIGDSDAGPGDHLDMNDPPTLELYSRVLLFSSDPLRDELSFSRSLSPAQRKTVHLIARKLELEHRSWGEGERRCVVVYKKGCAPQSEDGGGRTQRVAENGRLDNGTGGDRLARMDPPRRSLRGSVSSIVLRHVASRDALLASSPTDYLHPSNHDFSSPSRAPASMHPPRHQHSGSSSGGSSSMLPSPIGTGSNGPYTPQQHLRGKKSMPDMRYHSHSLSSVSASSGSGAGVGAAAASMAMLPSFSGSGSSGFGAHHQHQHHPQQQQYGHHQAGSGSSSPYDAYSTPASSPLAINPPGSGSTTGTGAAGRELTSSVSLGANLSGYLGAKSSYQYPHQHHQQFDQPPSRLADVAEAAFNAVPMYGDDSQRRQQQPVYEQHSHFPAVDSSTSGAEMMHGIRKSFSTMRLGDGPGGGGGGGSGSSGWNGPHFPSHATSGLAVEHDWPLDGTKTMGPRQIRRHVALPADWTQASQQQQEQSDRPSLQSLFSAEPNALARPSSSSSGGHGNGHGLRSTVSVGAGLRSGGFGGELEWRRRE